MFDAQKLASMGLLNQLVPIWQVLFYIAIMIVFLLLYRVRMCLLISFLFTYYLGFLVQWGDYITQSAFMLPFVLYAISGLALAIICAAVFFSEPRK